MFRKMVADCQYIFVASFCKWQWTCHIHCYEHERHRWSQRHQFRLAVDLWRLYLLQIEIWNLSVKLLLVPTIPWSILIELTIIIVRESSLNLSSSKESGDSLRVLVYSSRSWLTSQCSLSLINAVLIALKSILEFELLTGVHGLCYPKLIRICLVYTRSIGNLEVPTWKFVDFNPWVRTFNRGAWALFVRTKFSFSFALKVR